MSGERVTPADAERVSEFCADFVKADNEDAKELSPADTKNVAVWDRPSWPQEGWLRHEEKGS
jgi:hypothetical protein